MGLPSAPPFDLVQLSTIHDSLWHGRAVFHPMEQHGDDATWVDEEGEPAYDVGAVLTWEPDPDFADLGGIRVHFVGSFGSVLHYDATNLWTIRP